MSLFDRLVTPVMDAIPIHEFVIGLKLWQEGLITRVMFETEFAMGTNDPDLTFLKSLYDASEQITRFPGVLEDVLKQAQACHFGLETPAALANAVAAIT